MRKSPSIFEPRLTHLGEPLLEFRYGQRLAYPRDGLFLYGPVGDVGQLKSVRFGVIGTAEGVRRFNVWSNACEVYRRAPPGRRSRAIESNMCLLGFARPSRRVAETPAAVVADLDAEVIDTRCI